MKEKIKIVIIAIFSIFLLYIAYGGVSTYRYNYVYSTPQKMEYIVNHINNGFPKSNKSLLESGKFKNNHIKIYYGSGLEKDKVLCIDYETKHFWISLPVNNDSSDVWWNIMDDKGYRYIYENGTLYTNQLDKNKRKIKNKKLIQLYQKEMKEFTDKFGHNMNYQIYNPWNR